MTTRLTLNHWQDWLLPGNPDDTRLLHADGCDRIYVCPPHLGRGYIQEIPLQDDLSLFIVDYALTNDLVIDVPGESPHIEFEFLLAGPETGYSLFVPNFGFKQLEVKRSQRRFFKVEVIFKPPTLTDYFQAYLEQLSPQAQSVAERVIQAMYRYQRSGSLSTPVKMLSRVMQGGMASEPYTTFGHVVSDTLHAESVVFNYANRTPISPTMNQVIGQILSCPYQGTTRRIYLERQALKLVSLRLEAMVQPCLTEADLNSIYQAASILRNQLSNPPSIEALARRVCTNRLKLNQGFREVYDTTPYGYLRDCRLWQAQRLLTISDLAIADIAASVGYTNRSHFALAFRQWTGINPKTFQLQAWQWAS
ncbi:AraC family transcriptional regulator [Halomicronema hongdechloris C2206]|uniref:AraC family transcriptional regulator n=1 Tax=Halomicronema hongdechloris C2206 TaxID=1641165 RepID=A0A1Z3HQS5_9CYAN|nr:AraC family transcriptional regulator [Halomicronema hongdechloris]ASC72648.1 AraC family transcriptional regulator [Halomicronema hongdechloris C2206]